jgi:hypothetical protein
MRSKADMLAELRTMLHDVFVAKTEGAAYARLARAHGYVDGYMRAMMESGAISRDELLAVVARERELAHGPATTASLQSATSSAVSAVSSAVSSATMPGRGASQSAAALTGQFRQEPPREVRGAVGAPSGKQKREARVAGSTEVPSGAADRGLLAALAPGAIRGQARTRRRPPASRRRCERSSPPAPCRPW